MSVTMASGRVPILMYHKIAQVKPRSLTKGHYVSPALFWRQMRTLRLLGFESVSLNHLFEPDTQVPKRPIVITFDDGYQNFYDAALPVLRSVGFQSTVFLVANEIGGVNRWDAVLGDVEEPLMGAETIRFAAKMGTEFGSHTLDHCDLQSASKTDALKQIAESKAVIESILDSQIHTFCYPYGKMNQDTPELVRSAGYRLACSTKKGTNTESTDRYALRRINVRRDTWTAVLLLKLLRAARNDS